MLCVQDGPMHNHWWLPFLFQHVGSACKKLFVEKNSSWLLYAAHAPYFNHHSQAAHGRGCGMSNWDRKVRPTTRSNMSGNCHVDFWALLSDHCEMTDESIKWHGATFAKFHASPDDIWQSQRAQKTKPSTVLQSLQRVIKFMLDQSRSHKRVTVIATWHRNMYWAVVAILQKRQELHRLFHSQYLAETENTLAWL